MKNYKEGGAPPYASKQSFSSTPPSGDTPQRPVFVIAKNHLRHCERSEAIQNIKMPLISVLLVTCLLKAAFYFRRSPVATLPGFAEQNLQRVGESGNVST